MFAEHQKWRREYFPQGHAQEDEIKDELTAGKFFMQGHDRKGRPIALLLGAKHVSSKKTIERQKRRLPAVSRSNESNVASISLVSHSIYACSMD